MRDNICRIHIKTLFDKLDEFESKHDKIMIVDIITKMVLDTDILYDQYGDYDQEFNDYFEKKLKELYAKYPDKLQKQMDDFNQFKNDIDT